MSEEGRKWGLLTLSPLFLRRVPTGSLSISRRVLPGVTAPWTTMVVRSRVCVSVGVWALVRVCEVGVLAIPSSLAAGVHASFARGCVRRRKEVSGVNARVLCASLCRFSLLCWNTSHSASPCYAPLCRSRGEWVCESVCERERERALSLLSLLRHWQPPHLLLLLLLPASHTHFLQSGGLTRSLD